MLYLDRRNVELDPSEQVGRRVYPNSNTRTGDDDFGGRDNTRRGNTHTSDDEFGAVESRTDRCNSWPGV